MADYPFTPVIAGVRESVPFVGPEALERQCGINIRARLGANESVFGPSPKAVAAMQAAAADSWKYGDPENHDLKQALAKVHGVRPDNIVVGEGIDGLHSYTARLFVEPGVTVATSLGAYPTFNFHVEGCGGRIVTVPYRDDREDIEALLALARRDSARLIYLANPDNPMGTWWDASAVQSLIDAIPERSLLVLDEAYADFAPPGTTPPISADDPRVLRFRTFSKAHGLAGARIGYAIGEASLVRSFNRIRNHFGVTRMAQAGALAAIGDTAHVTYVTGEVRKARERMTDIARNNGLMPIPSATNFLAMDCGDDGAFARRALDGLLAEGIFARMPGVAPLNRCIRISAGTAGDLDLLAAALPRALSAARQG